MTAPLGIVAESSVSLNFIWRSKVRSISFRQSFHQIRFAVSRVRKSAR